MLIISILCCLYNLSSYFTILIFLTCDSYKCDDATVRRCDTATDDHPSAATVKIKVSTCLMIFMKEK